FSARKVRAPYVRPRPQDVEEVRGLLASGALRPVVGRRYPLAEAAEAVRDWEKGHTRGKSVLVV
ncbi:zinc-binding dehydrogenase, partial [Streptomyces phytophilus]|uniref:zinc-binding dehydrogenase n=1 Tax=Streptomyces phytophilus TaxID=722715 RepID=UPI0015EFF3E5